MRPADAGRTESPLWESNPRHQPYHGCALPTELRGRYNPKRGRAANGETSVAPEGRFAPVGHRSFSGPRHGLSDTLNRVTPITIRTATVADAPAIAAIYNRAVTETTATFDLTPRRLDEQKAWISDRSGAFSAIVAVDPDSREVIGFASLSPYKERAAYRTTVENSVYVHHLHSGRGVGRALMDRLIEIARESGFHSIIARIETSGEASQALHRSCGFELVGIEREIGRKFGRWLDTAIMQLLL